MGPVWQALHHLRLAPRQRMVLGGSLFVGAADFVYAVADGLGIESDRCPYVPGQGRDLKQRQDRALDLLFLVQGLRDLGDLVYDAYLQEQHGVITECVSTLRRVRMDREKTDGTVAEKILNWRRLVHLHPAQDLLTKRQRIRQLKKLLKKDRVRG